MTIADNIRFFQDLLRSHLKQHEQFFDTWSDADWHRRVATLNTLLHDMWQVYEQAEDNMSLLTSTFPPYPFSEITTLRKWLRQSIHRVEDFLRDEYQPSSPADYIQSYAHFLSRLCCDEESPTFVQSEQLMVESERQLLNMLARSYSVLLDLLQSSYDTLSGDEEQIILSYTNCRVRYEQLQWPKQKALLLARLENTYPWDNQPSATQLQQEYATIQREMAATTIGRLSLEYPDEHDFIIKLAQSGVSEEELGKFFLSSCQLSYLASAITDLREAAEEAALSLSAKSYCTYIVPTAARSRDEIEADLALFSQRKASVFARTLRRLYKHGELDFGEDDVTTVFSYLKDRYQIPYEYPNFSAVFSLPIK